MRSVGLKEFQDQATRLIGEHETLVIRSEGLPIGFYVPLAAKDRRSGREALGRLGRVVEEVLEQTGLTEAELVREVERIGADLEAAGR